MFDWSLMTRCLLGSFGSVWHWLADYMIHSPQLGHNGLICHQLAHARQCWFGSGSGRLHDLRVVGTLLCRLSVIDLIMGDDFCVNRHPRGTHCCEMSCTGTKCVKVSPVGDIQVAYWYCNCNGLDVEQSEIACMGTECLKASPAMQWLVELTCADD